MSKRIFYFFLLALALVVMPIMDATACNIAIATGNATKDGHILFAKNSNRGNEEAQRFISEEGGLHFPGSKVQCTWIKISQPMVTYDIRGGQPWWGWGFEQGMNENGVAIGNVAMYYSHLTPEGTTEGLTGMDLLRLALQRSKTAREAVDIIIELNSKYGNWGATHADGTGAYNNAYAIADANEVWILELPGKDYIAQKLPENGVYCLNNVPAIRTDYDLISPDLVEYAKEQGWYKDGEEFDFSYYFMVGGGNQQSPQVYSQIKKMRVTGLLEEAYGEIDLAYMMKVLRDRREGSWAEEPFMPYRHYRLIDEITETASTAGSLVVELRDDLPKAVANTYWLGMASTNTTPFTPIFWGGDVPEAYAVGEDYFDKDSPWWNYDLLDRMSRKNYETFTNYIRAVWKPVEEQNFREAYGLEKRVLSDDLSKSEVKDLLTQFHQKKLDNQVNVARGIFYSLQKLYTVLPGGYPPAYDDSMSDLNAGLENLFTEDVFN